MNSLQVARSCRRPSTAGRAVHTENMGVNSHFVNLDNFICVANEIRARDTSGFRHPFSAPSSRASGVHAPCPGGHGLFTGTLSKSGTSVPRSSFDDR